MKNRLEGEIKTSEQATTAVRAYCEMAIHARDRVDIEVPGDNAATVRLQRSMYEKWLMSYGAAVGALSTLHRAGKISDNAFQMLMAEVAATLQPKMVGNLVDPQARPVTNPSNPIQPYLWNVHGMMASKR